MLEIAGLAGFTTNMTEWSMFNKNRCFSLFFFVCRFCFKPIILELSWNWIWRTYENFVKRWCDQWIFVFLGGTSIGKTSMSRLKQFEHLIFVLVVFSDRYFLVFLLWFCGVIFLFASSPLRWVFKACWCWWFFFRNPTTKRGTFWHVLPVLRKNHGRVVWLQIPCSLIVWHNLLRDQASGFDFLNKKTLQNMSVAGLEVVYLMLLSFVKLMMANTYKIGINVFLTLSQLCKGKNQQTQVFEDVFVTLGIQSPSEI